MGACKGVVGPHQGLVGGQHGGVALVPAYGHQGHGPKLLLGDVRGWVTTQHGRPQVVMLGDGECTQWAYTVTSIVAMRINGHIHCHNEHTLSHPLSQWAYTVRSTVKMCIHRHIHCQNVHTPSHPLSKCAYTVTSTVKMCIHRHIHYHNEHTVTIRIHVMVSWGHQVKKKKKHPTKWHIHNSKVFGRMAPREPLLGTIKKSKHLCQT